MTTAQATAAADELTRIHHRAEALADTLDPHRTFAPKDEVTRTVVRSCDIIVRQSTEALSMLRVKFGDEIGVSR